MPDSPNMPDNISVLDQALGLAYAIPNFKRELKQDFISRLFENPEAEEVPEVKEELWDKEAGDSEMQTEKPKSLHGKKYDRRMKFNTALDRSEHQTTREGPAQMKNNDPEWMKEASEKLNAILGKQAGHSSKIAVDPDFSFNGQTGREQVVSIEDELLKTPPLPIGDTIFYSEPNKPVMQKECAEDIADKVIAKNRKKKPKSTGSFFDPALGIGAATAIGASTARKKLLKNVIVPQILPTDRNTANRNILEQLKIEKSLPEDIWSSKRLGTPEFMDQSREYRLGSDADSLMRHGPHFMPSEIRQDITRKNNPFMPPSEIRKIKPYIYSPRVSSPEIFAHEIGHSIQDPNFTSLSMPGRSLMRPKAFIPLNIAALISHAQGQGENPDQGRAIAYGTAALGAGAAIPTIANEIHASRKGVEIMRKAGLKPRFGHAYGGNATYALGAATAAGIPVSLAVKRFLKARKAKKLEGVSQTAEPIMEQAQQESGENL
jgi:hypothetical protein